MFSKISCENKECPLHTIFKNYEKNQDISPEFDCDKASVIPNKTFKSKLKKKVSRFIRVFTSGINYSTIHIHVNIYFTV